MFEFESPSEFRRENEFPDELRHRRLWSHSLLDDYLEECRIAWIDGTPLMALPSAVRILAGPSSLWSEATVALLERTAWLEREIPAPGPLRSLRELLTRLLRKDLDLGEDEIVELLDLGARCSTCALFPLPYEGLLRQIERASVRTGLGGRSLEALSTFRETILFLRRSRRESRIRHRIDVLLGRHLPQLIEPGEPWADAALVDLEAMDAAERSLWNPLVAHCRKARPRPSAAWVRRAEQSVESIGEEPFRRRVFRWFELFSARPEIDSPLAYVLDADTLYGHWLAETAPVLESNRNVLIGFVRCCDRFDDDEAAAALSALAAHAFRGFPEHGPVAPAVGFASAAVLSAMTSSEAAARLARILRRGVAGTLRTRVRRAIARCRIR